jgi:hypothetical protein
MLPTCMSALLKRSMSSTSGEPYTSSSLQQQQQQHVQAVQVTPDF